MNQKTLLALAAAAAVAVVAAVAINHAKTPLSEGAERAAEPLVPDLAAHLNDVDSVALIGAEGKPIATLKRAADGWTVAEKQYAADTAKIRELLVKLSDATLLEAKTSSPDKYATLGVDDVAAKDAKGVRVELGGLSKPVALIVGNINARSGGTYVRRADDAQSWLAKGTLAIDKTAGAWLRKDIADLPSSRVAEATLTAADGKTVRVYKDAPGDASFRIADVPKGREPASEFSANAIGSALAQFRLDDVLPASEAPPPATARKARVRAFDGVTVDVVAWEAGGKDYARVSASLDESAASTWVASEQAKQKAAYDASVKAAGAAADGAGAGAVGATKSGDGAAAAASANVGSGASDAASVKAASGDANARSTPTADQDSATAKAGAAPPVPIAVSDPAKDRDERLAALRKEVETINARGADRTFVVPPYKYANLAKSLEDLLKPLEPKAGAKPDAKSAPASAAPTKASAR